MKRLLLVLPLLLSACNGNVAGTEFQARGALGRFSQFLTDKPKQPTPALSASATPSPTPQPTTSPRVSPSPSPSPRPSASPSPSPSPGPSASDSPPPVMTLAPAPTPTPNLTPGFGAVNTLTRNVMVTFRDNGAEDGDRIQVLLNGLVVPGLDDLLLTNAGLTMVLNLHPGTNFLTVVALNEGSEPPNTCEVTLLKNQIASGPADQLSRELATGESDTMTLVAP